MDIDSYSGYLTGEQLTKIATYGKIMIEKIDQTRKELGED